MNYWKRRERAMGVARAYEHHALVGPKMTTTRIVRLDAARTDHSHGEIGSIDAGRKVRVLKSGIRRITYK